MISDFYTLGERPGTPLYLFLAKEARKRMPLRSLSHLFSNLTNYFLRNFTIHSSPQIFMVCKIQESGTRSLNIHQSH